MAIVSDLGTVVDVATSNLKEADAGPNNIIVGGDSKKVGVRNIEIKDYNSDATGTGEVFEDAQITSSLVTSTNEAGTGTIYALAKGKWSDSKMRSEFTKSTTALSGEDKVSTINFGVGLVMASKATAVFEDEGTPNEKLKEFKERSIAYVADNGGKITAKDTTMKGFGSIVAYAKDKGTIIVDGNITAEDKWVASDAKTEKVKRYNIGAYADGEKSTIAIKGNAKIYGTGAFADNKGEIVLKGSGTAATRDDDENTYAGNYIKVGKNPGLIAQDGGLIDFKGGIIHLDEKADKNALPFYVTSKEWQKDYSYWEILALLMFPLQQLQIQQQKNIVE